MYQKLSSLFNSFLIFHPSSFFREGLLLRNLLYACFNLILFTLFSPVFQNICFVFVFSNVLPSMSQKMCQARQLAEIMPKKRHSKNVARNLRSKLSSRSTSNKTHGLLFGSFTDNLSLEGIKHYTLHTHWRIEVLLLPDNVNDIKNHKHRNIVNLVIDRINNDVIASKLGVSKQIVQRTKAKYRELIAEYQSTDLIDIDVDQYSSQVIAKGKHVVLKMANTLLAKSMNGTTVGQLTQSMVALNTLIRLEEGKSTENIAHNIVHNLNEDQLNLLRDSIKNLKKSMLST